MKAVDDYDVALKRIACECWIDAYLSEDGEHLDIMLSFMQLAFSGLALRGWHPVFRGHHLSFRKEVKNE